MKNIEHLIESGVLRLNNTSRTKQWEIKIKGKDFRGRPTEAWAYLGTTKKRLPVTIAKRLRMYMKDVESNSYLALVTLAKLRGII